MNQDRNETAQEFMEEIVDDLGYTPKGGKKQGSGSTANPGLAPKFLIPWGIGIILLIFVIAFLWMGRSGDNTEELASIQAGLNRLEERMARLEGLKGLKELGGLEDRIIRLEKEEKRLQQEVKQIARRDVTSTPKKADPEVKQQYHTVRSGESLYTIAKKYGISTDRLCKLNKITPKEPIQPGQKLLVGE